MPEGQSRDRDRQLTRTAGVDSGFLKEGHSHAFYPIFQAITVSAGRQFQPTPGRQPRDRVQRRQTRTTWF